MRTKCSKSVDTRCKRHDLLPTEVCERNRRDGEMVFPAHPSLMTPLALRGMAGNKIGCARISMMVRSMSSNSRPDTLMQDRTLQAYRFLLQRTAGPWTSTDVRFTSQSGH